mmetsp:Transcript_40597/g.46617  ORF Transcript_40597/g.46617 Transcript_40597/m.46617 type:complete len:102 (+) Transcript_40597:165-470(+)
MGRPEEEFNALELDAPGNRGVNTISIPSDFLGVLWPTPKLGLGMLVSVKMLLSINRALVIVPREACLLALSVANILDEFTSLKCLYSSALLLDRRPMGIPS